MSKYPPADSTTQWFQDNFPGATMNLTAANTVLCLHTTEGGTWPTYSGGSMAPTYTALPRIARKGLDFRQHFPDEKSARALENHAGGVETNTLNCVQIELIGTCDPAHKDAWPGVGKAGVDYIFWPAAPDWLLGELAKFVAYLHRQHGLQLVAPKFNPYPASINANRMSGAQWSRFAGICGHQHVPENVHGDPGNLDVPKLIALTKAIVDPAPKPTGPRRAPRRRIFHVHPGQPYYLEDSWFGVLTAFLLKFFGIDFDIQKTKDAVLIVAHGPRPLAKNTRGGLVDPLGKIPAGARYEDLTWAEVSRLRSPDGKHKVWRADELVPKTLAKGMRRVELEAKTPHITEADWSDLFSHIADADRKKLIVKAFVRFLASLKSAHDAGAKVMALTHPSPDVPKSARSWLDLFRGKTPRWV